MGAEFPSTTLVEHTRDKLIYTHDLPIERLCLRELVSLRAVRDEGFRVSLWWFNNPRQLFYLTIEPFALHLLQPLPSGLVWVYMPYSSSSGPSFDFGAHSDCLRADWSTAPSAFREAVSVPFLVWALQLFFLFSRGVVTHHAHAHEAY